MANAYITQVGQFLPGDPIANDDVEAYLGRIHQKSSRLRQRILRSNGIQYRHYALDRQQHTTHQNATLAALAVRDALDRGDLDPQSVDLLCAATTWPDLPVPGFASMVHGTLTELPPLEATSHQGVCCAGIAALNYAVAQVRQGQRRCAVAVASELASRLFKHSQFEALEGAGTPPFDQEFLRWMLSDGAGAMVVRDRPNPHGLSLRVDWIELISHSSTHPLCMYAGSNDPQGATSWLDYPSYGAAAAAGAIHLRQNVRLLDQVIKLGVEGWLYLIEQGRIFPDQVDWLLCHYSSHFFRSQIVDLLEQARCMVPESRWFTNLYHRGNTGCASIYLMVEELFNSGKLQPGQVVFGFVPESGRFTTAYFKLTVVGDDMPPPLARASSPSLLPTPSPEPLSVPLLRRLMQVWLTFERQLQGVPLVRRLRQGTFSRDDYLALLRNLRPQVVEGARWIARAASNLTDFELRSRFIGHAQAEHRDFRLLEQNYVAVGGQLADIVNAQKNLGSEALSAFIFHQASQPDPIDLVGSLFIIEGLGNHLASHWAEQIRRTLGLSREQVSFLAYHGENDAAHVQKMNAILEADWMTEALGDRIVKTAQITARLYQWQLEEIVSNPIET